MKPLKYRKMKVLSFKGGEPKDVVPDDKGVVSMHRHEAEHLNKFKRQKRVYYEPVEEPKKADIEGLKAEADSLGLTYAPNISAKKLQERIDEFKNLG